MSIEKPSFTISTLQEVSREISFKPIVGFEKTSDLPNGWQFDIKRWCTDFDLKLPVLPRLSNPSYQGLKVEDFFKRGVGDKNSTDFILTSINQEVLNSRTSWIPKLNAGNYFRFNESFNFFSDDSIVQYIDSSENESERNVVLLTSEPNINSDIRATIFYRDQTTKFPRKYIEAQLVGVFSGIYISGEEQETIDDLGEIHWSNVDTTKKQFILDTSYANKYYLRFNRDFTFNVGRIISSYDEIGVCENIGIANGEDNQVYYTKYFPIVPTDVHVYVANDTAETFVEWTQVDSYFDLENSIGSNEYYVDKDLGAIRFGNGTNAPSDGKYIMVTYGVTMRIEYEPYGSSGVISSFDADVNPVNQAQNQGFICITHDKPEPANISLVIDKTIISGTSNPIEYGPIYAGSDYGILRAEVTSITGDKVSNINVNFSLTPFLGYLSGSSESKSLTNSKGYSFSSYQPPTNTNDLGFYSRTVNDLGNGSKEIIIFDEDAALTGKEEDIFLYQVLKDDLFLGHNDIDTFIINNISPPSWVNTPLNPSESTFLKWKEELILEYGWKEWEDPGSPDSGQEITGRKVVIYKIDNNDNVDTSAIDPTDRSTGYTVVPVKPTSVEKLTSGTYSGYWRAVYEDGAVPSVAGNVAGYWLGTSRVVKFKASCWSPYYNKNIESNEIAARISPPAYMLGEYLFNGDKVPYGWKLPDEFNNIAAAINGTTFITINPRVTPYNIVDIIGIENTDSYASNQFSTKVFRFEIIQ